MSSVKYGKMKVSQSRSCSVIKSTTILLLCFSLMLYLFHRADLDPKANWVRKSTCMITLLSQPELLKQILILRVCWSSNSKIKTNNLTKTCSQVKRTLTIPRLESLKRLSSMDTPYVGSKDNINLSTNGQNYRTQSIVLSIPANPVEWQTRILKE